MKSLIIGIVRPGKPNNVVLNSDTRYVSMCGNKPEVSFSIDCDQSDFLTLVDDLRYKDADTSASDKAISRLQDIMTQTFDRMKYLKIEDGDKELHIRLVTPNLELAQLPFEFVLAPDTIAKDPKLPLLALPQKLITLTREVRQESEVRYTWPSQARILFAWAQPGGEQLKVPHDAHKQILKEIVSPFAKPKSDIAYPEADWERLLTELPNASIKTLKEAIAVGVKEGRPYTHVHILAHGSPKVTATLPQFQLSLCKEGSADQQQKVDGQQLKDALVPAEERYIPAVVSLSVCDSANTGNTIFPSGSLVQQLHQDGIPCVFASQFPLTQAGSATLTRVLYRQLLNACDPRKALYEARMELKKEPTHDWASLVAYARFPDDINEQLVDARLKTQFGSMKIANAWVDHVFKYWTVLDDAQKQGALQELDQRLKESIDELSTLVDPNNAFESMLPAAELQAEHLGLLGSACKRKAEYLFRLIELQPEKREELIKQSAEALNDAKQYYYSGLDADPTNHWTAMQYLSLRGISESSLRTDIKLWYTICNIAEWDEKKARKEKREADEIWAWGTQAELYLLEPLTKDNAGEAEIETSIAKAGEYIQKITTADAKHNGAKESTARQLERYIHWWPVVFSSTYPEWLKDASVRLRNILPPLEDLLPVN